MSESLSSTLSDKWTCRCLLVSVMLTGDGLRW
jgi:hypothetical protein